ncbi:IS630 family transposase [Tardiphaga sp. vice278]|uniref:IS630 family transposase n=1 Tax=Tardiphaga sp. vice278 TaxID=2592815 RepID=UPI001FEE9924|nr:IS630 family transposase [Tardiphaga sp. vice278]
MAIPVALRVDFKASQLRLLARKTKNGPQARRLLALAAIYDGATRTEAARIGGVTLQIIRDWVMRFNARGAEGLLDGKSPGQPSRLKDVQRQAIVRLIESGPIPAIHGVVRWRLIDLSQWIYEEFRITIAKQTLSRELRAMGYRKLSARPRHHAQAEGAIEDFKKSFQSAWMKSRVKRPSMSKIEIWFQDEARIGQKNKITRRWAKRGTRPSAPRDQRTSSTYIFGAICPKQGKGAALILPFCNTEAMNLHLAEIAKAVAPGAHAVLLVDQAGWHLSAGLFVPANITIIPLPPKCPELNPVENIWQYMRDNWLSNRVFKSYDDIVDHCCYAWNTLLDRPWKIMSIGMRQWAHEF